MTKIKICGLTRHYDIYHVNKMQPDYVGFVFAPGKRMVREEAARDLRSHLQEGICPVGVFKDAEEEQILRLAYTGIINMIQLHGTEPPDYVLRLKERIHTPVIKAISVGDEEQEALMSAYQEAGVDFFLFDQGGGGTGKTFDWEKMPKTDIPFFMAGGLHAGNIVQAMALQPYAVDVSSGVESGESKDGAKIKEIVEIVRRRIK